MVSLYSFLYYTGRIAVIAEDSVRFAHSGPSHNLLRPAIAELVSCGPLPLPMSRPLKKVLTIYVSENHIYE